jgi:hypothetical protein
MLGQGFAFATLYPFVFIYMFNCRFYYYLGTQRLTGQMTMIMVCLCYIHQEKGVLSHSHHPTASSCHTRKCRVSQKTEGAGETWMRTVIGVSTGKELARQGKQAYDRQI